MFDKKAMLFQAEVVEIAKERLNARCEGTEAEPFLDMIYREYQEAGEPREMEEWIESRLRSEFLFVSEPPRWVEAEPSWPFHEGRPMVFISQTFLPRNWITEDRLTWNAVVYLFGARVPEPRGYRVHYRTEVQHPPPGASADADTIA